MSNDNRNMILEIINEQLITLSIDTEHLAMALQAVKTDDLQSKGIIQAVIIALFSNVSMTTDMSEQLDSLLSKRLIGGDCHE